MGAKSAFSGKNIHTRIEGLHWTGGGLYACGGLDILGGHAKTLNYGNKTAVHCADVLRNDQMLYICVLMYRFPRVQTHIHGK